jgi:hypothetical protein
MGVWPSILYASQDLRTWVFLHSISSDPVTWGIIDKKIQIRTYIVTIEYMYFIMYHTILHMWSYPRPSGEEGACSVDRASQPNDAMNIIGPTAYGVIFIYIVYHSRELLYYEERNLVHYMTFRDVICNYPMSPRYGEDSKG